MERMIGNGKVAAKVGGAARTVKSLVIMSSPTTSSRFSRKYQNKDYTGDGPENNRVIFKIRPERVIAYG